LAEPRELTPEEKQRIAQTDFDYWFDRAAGFIKGSDFYYKEGDLRMAAFNLNQAAESAYKAIFLVFTSYCPHEHLLAWLGEEAAQYGPVFHDIFPQTTDEERDRFRLLDRAYIGARYRKDFIVFWGGVEYLAPRVRNLLDVTETICRNEIERIGEIS
jgi:HEPN domain-containing protein